MYNKLDYNIILRLISQDLFVAALPWQQGSLGLFVNKKWYYIFNFKELIWQVKTLNLNPKKVAKV
jgi:hypothetical protein